MKRTVLYQMHVAANARMVEFGGWEMPIHYATGIVEEHLTTRKNAGLFDVSHMGRISIRGKNAVPFLQYVLTNNCAGLQPGEAQYTMIANERGGAIDDAYLYRFFEEEFLLVVNAANCEGDLAHFRPVCSRFADVDCVDVTDALAMISFQGPASKGMLQTIVESGELPEPLKNCLSEVQIDGVKVLVARTGYTGEPLGFELFAEKDAAPRLWQRLVECGARPVGLGARDTLRMEAGLPLYGHELGTDPEGREIPVFSCPLARFAVSFSPLKQEFIGELALSRQFSAYQKILNRDYSSIKHLPHIIRSVAVLGKGIARSGARVFSGEKQIGWVTSGTMAPYWKVTGFGVTSTLTEERGMRAICLALLDSDVYEQQMITVEIRDKRTKALTVSYHLRSEAPPHARSIVYSDSETSSESGKISETQSAPRNEEGRIFTHVNLLVRTTIDNTQWRQQQCINLIPSGIPHRE